MFELSAKNKNFIRRFLRFAAFFVSIEISALTWCESDLYAENTPSGTLSDEEFNDILQNDENIILFGTYSTDQVHTLLAENREPPSDETEEIWESDDMPGPDHPNGNRMRPGRFAPESDSQPPTATDSPESFIISALNLICDLEYCDNQDNVEALMRASGLHLGKRISSKDVDKAIERLKKTGYFSHVNAEYPTHGEHREILFKTIPHTRVRKLKIKSHGSIYASDIKKHMIIRPGSAIYPRESLLKGKDPDQMTPKELMDLTLSDQEQSLTKLYAKEGYLDAKVTISMETVEPYVVDINVTGEDINGYQLGKLYVHGHHIYDYNAIETTFRSGVSLFSNFTREKVEDAAALVLDKYRQDGYIQTQLKVYTRQNKETHKLDVFLDIKEAKKWVIHFEGNETLSSKELTRAAELMDSGYIDNAQLASAAEKVRNHYIASGFYRAETNYEMLISRTDTPSIALFKIKEGSRAEIGEIVFDGSTKQEQFADVISSQTYSTFGSGAYPQRSMIADDAAKIVDAYREIGYLNADVSSWTLVPLENSDRLKLTFIVHEGKQAKVVKRDIVYRDLPEYETKNIELELFKHPYFNDATLRAEQSEIIKLLRSEGYATVKIKTTCNSYDDDHNLLFENSCDIAELPPDCFPDNPVELCKMRETENGFTESCRRHKDRISDEENAEKCAITNGVFGTQIEIRHEITLGPKYTIGDIFVHGNMKTRDWVIRQDLPFKRGDVFDYNKVLDARSRMRARTIYQSATVNVIGLGDETNQDSELTDITASTEHPLPIVVSVEESTRQWVDISAGISLVSSDWIAALEIEYANINLFGTGWDFRALIMPEARFVNESNEWVLFEAYNQNWFTLLTLQIPIIPSQDLNLVTQLFYDLRYIPDTSKEEQGINLELQWKASNAWFLSIAFEAKLAATASLAIIGSENLSTTAFCYPFAFSENCPFSQKSAEQSQTYSLTPKFIYDGRDSPLNPKSGFYAEAKFKTAYSDIAGFYFRPEVKLTYLVTFLKYFTLGFNMRWGLTFMNDNAHLPLIDRFFLGGLNMRGFADEALGPRLIDSEHPNVATNEAGGGETLFNFTAELRFPIWQSMNIYGVVFLDAGSLLYEQPIHYSALDFGRELFVNEMRYTAGLGLRWLIAENIPPIVIDYGFILNRRRGDPIGGLNLNIGYTF